MSYSEMVRLFGRIGLLSFGGPAAQIALMHKELVEDRNALSEAEFLQALSFCMLLPGPEAMQLATYAGWRQRGIIGGLIGGGLFVVPGAIIIAFLALLYGEFGNQPLVQAMFVGVQATIVIVVIAALRKVTRRALLSRAHWVIAIVAFIALFAFSVPFPLVILTAGIIGAWMARHTPTTKNPPVSQLQYQNTIVVILCGIALWAAPVLLVAWWDDGFLLSVAGFFSRLAVVTFGGAYAVLAYMTQEIVTDYGWLTTTQMMDALGLAETTPGPLILVTQFVGTVAGAAQGGWAYGLLAGLLTLWVTFVPCFIWIFAGAPLIGWISGQPRLRGALAAITAAVVGVIANLSLWFALHVFFNNVVVLDWGIVQITLPNPASINMIAVLLALLAAFALWGKNWPLPAALGLCGVAGLCIALVMGEF